MFFHRNHLSGGWADLLPVDQKSVCVSMHRRRFDRRQRQSDLEDGVPVSIQHYEAQNTDTNQTSWLMNTDRVADGTDSAPSLWATAPGWPLTPSTLSQWDSTSTTALTVSRFDSFVPSTVIKENIRQLSVLSSTEKAANVCYQEYDVPGAFRLELRQFLPNVNYRAEAQRQDFICHYYYQDIITDICLFHLSMSISDLCAA